jgi:hypothetical protein
MTLQKKRPLKPFESSQQPQRYHSMMPNYAMTMPSLAMTSQFQTVPARLRTPSLAMTIRSGTFNSNNATLNEVLKNIAASLGDAKMDDSELILKVFFAAQKFQLSELQLECTDALISMIDSKNALDLLKISHETGILKLEDKILTFIMK